MAKAVTDRLTFHSILCPVDFSDHSRRALRFALALSWRARQPLDALAVNEPLLVEAAAAAYDEDYLKNETETELRKLVAELVPGDGTRIPAPRFHVAVGDPAGAILETAEQQGSDLIVMGTHGLGGYRKLFFGSTTARVLRKTRTPVLAMPVLDREPVTLGPSEPTFDVSPVLAPLDLETVTDADVEGPAEVAKFFGATLLLIHVVKEVRARAAWREPLAAVDRIRLARARQRLDLLARHIGSDLVSDTIVRVGNPSEEISVTAAERRAGLVVMGLARRGGIFQDRPGSVAYRVLSLAPAPVLVLPSPDIDREGVG